MPTSRSLRAPRPAVSFVAVVAALLAGAGLVLAPTARATASFDLERIAGNARWDTAAAIGTETFPDGSDNAIIANAVLDFPDALAANYLAGALEAPILLSLSNDVPDATMNALDDLGVTKVTLVGGTGVLGSDMKNELEDAGYTVDQIGGTNRFDTAERIARSQGAAAVGEFDTDRTAVLVNGLGFVDALVSGPIAYASSFPVVLTPPDELGPDAEQTLVTLEIERVIIVGGSAAVSGAAENDVKALGMKTQRVQGANRFATATLVAEFAQAQLGFDDSHVEVATGLNFPDAIAGGPHGGVGETAIVLVGGGVPEPTCDFLASLEPTLVGGHLFGGTGAISPDNEIELERCGGASGSNQAFAVAPGTEDDVLVEESRDFTATGVDVAATELALIPCNEVSVSGGVATFSDSDDNDRADGMATAPAATITRVNGVDGDSGDRAEDVAPVDGTVTFSITGDANGCAAGVLWEDTDGDGQLNLDADNRPTEAFGVGGNTNVFAVGGLSMTPATDLRFFKTEHLLTAQILDRPTGQTPPPKPSPAPGQSVRFTVGRIDPATELPGGCTNSLNQRPTVTSNTVLTDADGTAMFAYVGPSDPSGTDDDVIDCISVFIDLDGDGTADQGEPTATATVTWDDEVREATEIQIETDRPSALVGSTSTATVDLLDQYGDGLGGQPVTIELFRGSSSIPVFVEERSTSPGGRITLSYNGPATQADDRLVACVENPNDADEENVTADNDRCDVVVDDDANDNTADTPNDQATVKWVVAATAFTETAHDSCVLSADLAKDTVDVEDSGSNGRNLRLRYDLDDQYNIVTSQGPVVSTTAVLQSEFENIVSGGDRIRVSFAPNGVSTFTIYDDDNCVQDVSEGEPSTNGAFG